MTSIVGKDNPCDECEHAKTMFFEKGVELRKVPVRKHSHHPEIKCPQCGSRYVLVIDGRVQTDDDFEDVS